MKPSWDDAPDGAEWLAKDQTGFWHWFKNMPELAMFEYKGEDVEYWRSESGFCIYAGYSDTGFYFADSLEKRP
jgi:hypothetical protein